MELDPFVHAQRYRSGNRGRDRTIRRSRRLRRWGRILSVCRHLLLVLLVSPFEERNGGSRPRKVGENRGKGKYTNHDQPLRLLNTVGIRLRIPQCLDLDALGFLDLCGSSVTDEDGLASPFDDDLYFLSISILLFRDRLIARRTFLPSGMFCRSTSTLAMARTSADADMLTKKSGVAPNISSTSQLMSSSTHCSNCTNIHPSIRPTLCPQSLVGLYLL